MGIGQRTLQKKHPSSKTAGLSAYAFDLSLNRLNTGVDNIRHDVYFSTDFCKVVRNFVFQIIVKQTHTEDALHIEKRGSFSRIREQFRRHYREISLYGINRAKSEHEIQVDSLTQISVIKLLLDTLPEQYEHFQERLKDIIRGYELSNNQDEAVEHRKKMFTIQENRHTVIRIASEEVFLLNLREINEKDLNEMRRINFGSRTVIPRRGFFQSHADHG